MRFSTSSAICALLSTATLAPTIVLAQVAPKATPAAVDEVVVTGSRIARRDYVSDSPLVTIDQSAIASSGSVTLESSLNTLPQITPSASSGTNSTARGGQASLDLRGLGQQRTLVLIDGRRMQPSGVDGSVDLNTIPSTLIENVEIITGGASAVYGSDAVAGVVNLKLRKHINGVEVSGQYGATDRKDGETLDLGALIGSDFADDRGQAYIALNYSERDSAKYIDRNFLRSQGIVTALPTATINVVANNLPSQAAVDAVFGSYGVPTGGVSRSSQFRVNTDGSLFVTAGPTNLRDPVTLPLINYQGTLQYSAGNAFLAQNPLTRYNMLAHVNYNFGSSVKVFAQGMFTNYVTSSGNTPANAGSTSGLPLVVPVANPFISSDLASLLASRPNPGAPITVSSYIDEVGNRRETDEYTVYQLTAGAEGKAAPLGDANWSVYGSYGRTNYLATEKGYPSSSAINTLLSAPDGGRSLCAGGLNLFGFAPISQSCVDYISRIAKNSTKLEQTVVEANLTGRLLDLPAGELRYAAGVDYRKNSYKYAPDALVQTGDLANFLPVAPSSGSESMREIYGELLIPLVKDLPFAKEISADVSYRYSDYDTVGGVSTYKVDGSWDVVDGLRIRGGYSRAIRAPSVGELYAAAAQGQSPLGSPGVIGSGDPCDVRGAYRAASFGKADQVRALCLAQGVPSGLIDTFANINPRTPFLQEGNLELHPEAADTYSLGAVIRPRLSIPALENISASVDFYHIRIDDAIGYITNNVVADQCFNTTINASFDNSNYYCQLIQRDPANGQIIQISNPQLNLSSYSTSGVDFQVDWRARLEDFGLDERWGAVSVSVVGSYLRSFKIQNLAGSPTLDYAGTIGNTQIDYYASAHPTWKAVGTIGWDVWKVESNLRWRYIDAMKNAKNVGNTGTAKGVGDVLYWDFDTLVHVTRRVDVRAGVVNLFDKDPPTLNVSLSGAFATDVSTYDVLGRRFYIGVKARF